MHQNCSVRLSLFQLLDRMSHFCGELAAKAESYAKNFFRTSDPATFISKPTPLLDTAGQYWLA